MKNRMCRINYLTILMLSTLLTLVACTGTGTYPYRQTSEGHTDASMEDGSSYTLKNGQKGRVTINDRHYTFELLRINSQNNVTIVLQNGKKFHLPKKTSKLVQFDDDLEEVTFELDRVIQDAAIIHVRKSPQVMAKTSGKTITSPKGDTLEKIQLTLTIVQNTTVKLSLDGQGLKEIPLPQGTRVHWEAENSVDIKLPEADKARLEINGTTYKSSNDVTELHLFAKIKDGKLTVEYR